MMVADRDAARKPSVPDLFVYLVGGSIFLVLAAIALIAAYFLVRR